MLMSGRSGSFGALDEAPSTPISLDKTPVMSQHNTLDLVINTPPALHGETDMPCFSSPTNLNTPPAGEDAQNTPSIFVKEPLTCPSWHPPDKEEVEYTDAWNNSYDNRHHYMQPPVAKDDSTIGSNQTNDSFNVGSFPSNGLRPRGFSVHSYDAHSIGSCPHPVQRGAKQHRRNPSLPISLTGGAGSGLGSGQQLFQAELHKQYLNSLQSTKMNSPYELHAHHNSSQIKADGAMAGLNGVLLDLYMVDRSVDSASANMLAAGKSGGSVGGGRHSRRGSYDKDVIAFVTTIQEDIKNDDNEESAHTKEKPRMTALGTKDDIHCILELYKVDKTVDKFKHDLQMPQFFEEEAHESTVWNDLRRTDVEMEEYARKKRASETKENRVVETEVLGQQGSRDPQYQFELSDDEEDDDIWNPEGELGGEDIYLHAESLLTDYDAYQFFDPHEAALLNANSYHSTQVSASINMNLDEVIDLLRIDAEIDGASRRHKEMMLINPLLEIDLQMDKLKDQSEAKDMWVGDLRDLYLVDVEVDGGTKKFTPKPQSVKNGEVQISDTDEKAIKSTKEQDLSPIPSKQHTKEEAKAMLSQHSPQVPKYCPTSPQHTSITTTTEQASDFALPPPVPMSPPVSTRRAIFSAKEKKIDNAATTVVPAQANVTTTPKRSIFSKQEKTQVRES